MQFWVVVFTLSRAKFLKYYLWFKKKYVVALRILKGYHRDFE